MGWVSYLEDIQERFSRTLGQFDHDLEYIKVVARQAKIADLSSELWKGIATFDRIREHMHDLGVKIDKLLDLATDPHLDMARKIVDLQQENAEISNSIRTNQLIERERKEYEHQIARLTQEIIKLKAQIEEKDLIQGWTMEEILQKYPPKKGYIGEKDATLPGKNKNKKMKR